MNGTELRSGTVLGKGACAKQGTDNFKATGIGPPKFDTPKPIGRLRRTKFRASKEYLVRKGRTEVEDLHKAASLDSLLDLNPGLESPGRNKNRISIEVKPFDVGTSSSSEGELEPKAILGDSNEGNDLEDSEDDQVPLVQILPYPVLPVEPLDIIRPFLNEDLVIHWELPIQEVGNVNEIEPEVIEPVHLDLVNVNMANNITAYRPPTFHGTSKEDGIEFLRLFRLYCEMHNVVLVEPQEAPAEGPATADACRRFKLCISGDAARWCSELPPDVITWPLIEAAFRQKYCNLANSWAENVKLRNITQAPGQPVEEYLERFCEQARRMGKNLATCVTDMVEGMLPDIQREVLMKAPGGVEEMLTHAKLADTVYNKPALSRSTVSHFKEGATQEQGGELQGVVQELRQLALEWAEKKDDCINYVQNGRGPGQTSQGGRPVGPPSSGGESVKVEGNYGNNRNDQGSYQQKGYGNNGQNKQARGGGYQGRNRSFNGDCYNCGKIGHRAADCWAPRNNSGPRNGNRGRGRNGRGGYNNGYNNRGGYNSGGWSPNFWNGPNQNGGWRNNNGNYSQGQGGPSYQGNNYGQGGLINGCPPYNGLNQQSGDMMNSLAQLVQHGTALLNSNSQNHA